MGKTRDLFKIIRDTKGTFHAKMGSIKDRNGKDLTEDIKKRRQKEKEEEVARIHRRTIQKRSSNPGNYDGVITHLEPGILECEVRWALGSITRNKASGGDDLLLTYFKS